MIVVTGAGGSLGPYVARRLHDDGHELALVDTATDRIAALPGAHHAVDLLDEQATRAFAAELGDAVTGVVHLVGGWRGGQPLDEASLDDWALLHDLLIRTVQHTTRAFAGALKAAGERGRFVLISAAAAQAPTSPNASYAAAKAAAEAWTLAYADALAESRGTANILVVNAIVTDEMRAKNPDKAYRTFTDARHIADAVALLLSESAVAMSGQRLQLHQ
jgi:NAD(P)-dependent dehydrogenase (short-subunit alcohol dehydrogenase family)